MGHLHPPRVLLLTALLALCAAGAPASDAAQVISVEDSPLRAGLRQFESPLYMDDVLIAAHDSDTDDDDDDDYDDDNGTGENEDDDRDGDDGAHGVDDRVIVALAGADDDYGADSEQHEDTLAEEEEDYYNQKEREAEQRRRARAAERKEELDRIEEATMDRELQFQKKVFANNLARFFHHSADNTALDIGNDESDEESDEESDDQDDQAAERAPRKVKFPPKKKPHKFAKVARTRAQRRADRKKEKRKAAKKKKRGMLRRLKDKIKKQLKKRLDKKKKKKKKKKMSGAWGKFHEKLPPGEVKAFNEAREIGETPQLMGLFDMVLKSPAADSGIKPLTEKDLNQWDHLEDSPAAPDGLGTFESANNLEMAGGAGGGSGDMQNAIKSLFPIIQMQAYPVDGGKGSKDAKEMVKLLPEMEGDI